MSTFDTLPSKRSSWTGGEFRAFPHSTWRNACTELAGIPASAKLCHEAPRGEDMELVVLHKLGRCHASAAL